MNTPLSPTTPAPTAEQPIGYFVLAWIAPDMAAELLEWLTRGHIREVLAQPGMLDAQVTVLQERSAQGQVGVLCAYKVRSESDYLAYQASSAKARFNQEGMRFAGKMTAMRWHGEIVLSSSGGVA